MGRHKQRTIQLIEKGKDEHEKIKFRAKIWGEVDCAGGAESTV